MSLSNVYKKYKVVFKNFSFLSILQFVQLAVTFFTYPYLIKTLGQENYGIIAYSQAIVGYFTIIINYGFNATATKEIAHNRENKVVISEIVNAVFFAKFYLFVASLIIFLILVFNVSFLSQHKWIYILTFFTTLGWVAFPDWYFQGIEKMQNMTYAMVISRVLSVIIIFLFIKKHTHYIYVPIINSLSMIIAGAIGVLLVVKSNNKIHFYIPKFTLVKEQYKKGFAYFTSNLTANTKDYLNTILIGAFLNYYSVAIYDLVNKIIKVLILPCSILGNAIFPTVTLKKSLSFNVRVGRIMLYYSLLVCSFLFLIPYEAWSYLIKVDLEQFKYTLHILSFSLPLLTMTISKGFLTLVGFNEDKYFTKGILLSIMGYFIFIGFLILFKAFNLYTAAFAINASLILEIIIYKKRITYLKKKTK